MPHITPSTVVLTALAAFLLPAPRVAAQSGQDTSELGHFRYTQRADAEGEDRSMILTHSEEGAAALGWQCTGTGLRVFMALDRHHAGNEDDDILVTYRLPEHDPREGFWRLAATGTVAWMRIGHIYEFTEAARDAPTVTLSLTDPFDNEDRSARFGIEGLAAGLELLPCEMRRESLPGGG